MYGTHQCTRCKKYHLIMVNYRHKWSCSKTLSILSHVQHSGSDALVHKLFINDYNNKKIKPLTQGSNKKTKLSRKFRKKISYLTCMEANSGTNLSLSSSEPNSSIIQATILSGKRICYDVLWTVSDFRGKKPRIYFGRISIISLVDAEIGCCADTSSGKSLKYYRCF